MTTGSNLRFTARSYWIVGLVAVSVSMLQAPDARAEPKGDVGYFFSVKGAKDCAFDEAEQRLYVTTDKKLIVLDTKERKMVKSIDLAGGLRACDISPDFKYLAIAPITGHFIYWIELDGLKINQVRFKAGGSESGVFDLCIGSDNTVLFSMTFAGSGWVKLRTYNPATNKVDDVGKVRMDSIVAPSSDRRFAAIAEGNISSAPLSVYDFEERKLKKITNLGGFIYEFACGPDAKYFARPQSKGCTLYTKDGGKLTELKGKPVICAAFHPDAERLYLMRDGELSIQQYDIDRSTVTNAFSLDKPLLIRGDVSTRIVGHLHAVGPNMIMAHFRRVRSVHYRAYRSGRLRVSETGKNLFAVIPTGVYMFSLTPPDPTAEKTDGKTPGPKINVIEAEQSK